MARTNSDAETTPESLEKVREILFGSQVRTFDKQIGQVADRLSAELTASKVEAEKRHKAFETFVKDELSRLEKKLASEISLLGKGTAKLEESVAKSLTKVQAGFDKNADAMKEKIDTNDRQVREHILGEVNSLHDQLGKHHEDLTKALNAAVADLAGDKASRTSLALLFNELAARLSEDGAPGEKSGGSTRSKR